MANNGEISSSEYAILIEKGLDLGFSKETVDLLIKLELSDFDGAEYVSSEQSRGRSNREDDEEIHTYKKRNKFLINVDSVTISISKISSVELDTSLWGTDIIIKTYGSGEIIGRKFTKSDANEIRKLIQERINKLS